MDLGLLYLLDPFELSETLMKSRTFLNLFKSLSFSSISLTFMYYYSVSILNITRTPFALF